MSEKFVIAIDQGTTSSRAILFTHAGEVHSVGQKEHEQIGPPAAWVEQDPAEDGNTGREVIGEALPKANLTRHDTEVVGITTQRGAAGVRDKNPGEAVNNAIVSQDA